MNTIAPCGMNCGICLAYLREMNRCVGCREDEGSKPNSCRMCIIKNCDQLTKTSSGFCCDCLKFPCVRLKQLDKRYRTKYGMSMIENLESIKTIGLEKFVKNENERWKCKSCGKMICVHREFCLSCKNPR